MKYTRDDDHEKSIEAYTKSLKALPEFPDSLRLRAEAYLSLGKDAETVSDFTEYLKYGTPLGDVYRPRGLAYKELGQDRKAQNDYTRSLELEPEKANILTRRGWAYMLDAAKLAKEDFEDAVKINPENPDAYNGRGYAKVMLGDFQGAINDANEAVKWARKQAEAKFPGAWHRSSTQPPFMRKRLIEFTMNPD
ncbi:MAG: hypothetical protein CMJ78_23665 [Planctomycetaceae bacterium]|nr:hypothetical protein [Planctomycetaceae bacterium]